MPNYLSPGVYVEEVSSGSKPIEGVGTAVAAFVGFAEKGPLNAPTLVTNWTQFTTNFGSFLPFACRAAGSGSSGVTCCSFSPRKTASISASHSAIFV